MESTVLVTNNDVKWPSSVQVSSIQRMFSQSSMVQSKWASAHSFLSDSSLICEMRLFTCFVLCETSLFKSFWNHVLANTPILKVDVPFLQVYHHSVFFFFFSGENHLNSSSSSIFELDSTGSQPLLYFGETKSCLIAYVTRRETFSDVVIFFHRSSIFLCHVFAYRIIISN